MLPVALDLESDAADGWMDVGVRVRHSVRAPWSVFVREVRSRDQIE